MKLGGVPERVRVWTSVAAILVGLVFPSSTSAATIQELLNKQAALRQQAAETERRIAEKKRQASNIQEAIADIEGDINYTASRINSTENQIFLANDVLKQLSSEISDAQGQMDQLNERLRIAYIALYELSQINTGTMVLQGDSLSESVTQGQYIQAIQDQLQKDISKVNTLLADLSSKKSEREKQKSGLEQLSQQLESSKASLDYQKSQKNNLLAQTQGEQVRYQGLLDQIQKQTAQISDAIYRARQAAGGFVSQSGSGGYPWAGRCDQVDPWLYYTCQCTSYAAWKFQRNFGVPFRNTRPGAGSAYNWPALASDQGYTVSSSPRVGAAVSWNRPLFPGDQWGHVAIVEAVYSSTDIVVSEYNWSPPKGFSQRRINPYAHGTPRYIFP